MNFIEQLLGVSPDGGSGSLEFILFAIPICGIFYLAARLQMRKRHLS